MATGAGAVSMGWSGSLASGDAAVARLARWLLVAVALDLLVTRFFVRLAIFVPKDEPLATVGAVVGRVGAAIDALVPLLGLVLLGGLLLRAGRGGGLLERVQLLGIAVVGAGGFALLVLPPTAGAAVSLDLVVATLAVGAAVRLAHAAGASAIARVGLVSLAAAVALAAAGRVVVATGVLAGFGASFDGGTSGAPSLQPADLLGQVAFVAGAALVGLGGLGTTGQRRQLRRRSALLGLGVAGVVLAAATFAPLTWGSLQVWSLGLSGVVPAPVVALALGIAAAGLPALHRRAPAAAVGASVALLAGHGLAASGLLLAGLLGLVVAGTAGRDGADRAEDVAGA
jgi:hypothetical protein